MERTITSRYITICVLFMHGDFTLFPFCGLQNGLSGSGVS